MKAKLFFALLLLFTFHAINTVAQNNNGLLSNWTGPYGGIPPFDKVKVKDFKPAFEVAMSAYLTEIDQIANNNAKATFDNTIAALEKAGKSYNNVSTIYRIWGTSMKDATFAAVEREMAPKLAGLSDKIAQNEKLFKRIDAIYQTRAKANLTPEQQRLTWFYYNNFIRAGARLNESQKKRLSEINQQLAAVFTRFSQNVLSDESNEYLHFQNKEDLDGLSESQIGAAVTAAKAKKLEGWVITNTRSSIDPFITNSNRRALREKAWRMFVNRGDNGNATDNNANIAEILQLRAERAKLLGYATHAHLTLDNAMAKTPEKAMELMEAVWKPAVKRVKEEVVDMQRIADKEGAGITIEPWDYKYYAEKVRKAKYDLDQEAVKEYLQLDKLREGMFWVAGELFNFQFKPVNNVPVFHPDVKVWEVKDKATGKHIGVWYFDPYARDGKRSGAWMNAYRSQQKLEGNITTIVSNNANFVKGAPGEPVLISWSDARTLFHEFGHALHGLSSNVTYPSLASPNVTRDYVEFPSQLLEHWLSTPEVLQRFAVHYKTGKPIPKSLVDRIEAAATFNQGFTTTEYLASALVDMKYHLAGDQKIDPDKFEKETLESLGMPREIVMRHRSPQFTHVFSSDGYAAGYYSYLWSDVITADAFNAFTEGKGPYDKAVAERLRKYIFNVGNTIDPAEGYIQFRGRNPDTKALMIKRGFMKPEQKK